MSGSRPARRGGALVAVALVLASVAGIAGPGAAPAGAFVPAMCITERHLFICGAFNSFGHVASDSDLAYWDPRLPAQKTLFLTTLSRSVRARYETIGEYYRDYADRSMGTLEWAYWQDEVLKKNGYRRLQAGLYAEYEGTTAGLVGWAFHGLIGREPTTDEITYWGDRAEATSATRMAAALAGTPEHRGAVVRFTYDQELGYFPDPASLAYWSERLRTGLGYVELRVAVISSGYPRSAGCSSLSPPVRPECVPD